MSYVCKFHNVFYFNLQAKKFDSDVGVSDSDLESLDDDLHENVNETDKGEDSDDDDDCDEHWDEISPEILGKDISSTPLPEPELRKNRLQKVNALVFWFVYFLLFWQTSCKLSDNGLARLIQFLVQFLKVLGLEISNGFLMELFLFYLRRYIVYGNLSILTEILSGSMLFALNVQNSIVMTLA